MLAKAEVTLAGYVALVTAARARGRLWLAKAPSSKLPSASRAIALVSRAADEAWHQGMPPLAHAPTGVSPFIAPYHEKSALI